ncbi:gp324 [Bacillus phage G]|uniref:Gp324 n=1 Tax=Bacillus phage G TaxID=2884420 RepID=G3MA65_9CAUD|nr:gp324 [Bacillus phage G]AEO93583.1 gp324 [Bacillus phage G]
MINKLLRGYIKVEEKEKEINSVRDLLNQEIVKHKKDFRSEKKKSELLEKQIQEIRSQMRKDNKDVEKLEKEVSILKTQVYESKVELNKKEVYIGELEVKLKELDELLKEKNNLIKLLSESELMKENNSIKEDNNRLLNRIQMLNKRNIELNDNYKQLELELSQEKSFNGNGIEKYNTILDSLKKELAAYKNKIIELESNVEVTHLLGKLNEYLTEDTLNEFEDFDVLSGKIQTLRYAQQEKELEKQMRIKEAFDNPEMGYVVKENKHWFFYNLSNKSFEIVEIPDNLIDGVPAKAAIIDSIAVLIDVYSIKYNREEVNKHKSKSSNQKSDSVKEKVSYTYFGDFKVLIVGSRNKTHYTERLQKHGVEVIWHNAYEESAEQLRSKFKSADITLICIRHIPHDVTNIIDVHNEENVEIVDRDNKDSITAKTHFLALKLNLLAQ